MVGHEGNRRVVVAADAAARAAGVHVGMPATKAQALVPGLVIQNANPDDDGKALERLAAWALRYCCWEDSARRRSITNAPWP